MPRSRSPASTAGENLFTSPLKVSPRAIRFGSSMACLRGIFHASSPTSVLALYSRMAEPGDEVAGAIEDDDRCHGGARALAALHGVGHQLATLGGHEGEVGELVVEDEATDRASGAEDRLHGRRHRHDIAIGVDHHEVAGARGLGGGIAPAWEWDVSGRRRRPCVIADQLCAQSYVRRI